MSAERTTKREISLELTLTPEEVADAFAHMNASEQQEVIESVAETFYSWGSLECDTQMSWMVDTDASCPQRKLNQRGRDFIAQLAGWVEMT